MQFPSLTGCPTCGPSMVLSSSTPCQLTFFFKPSVVNRLTHLVAQTICISIMITAVNSYCPSQYDFDIESRVSCRGRRRMKTLSGWLRRQARSNWLRSCSKAHVPTSKGGNVLRFSQVAEAVTAVGTSSGSSLVVLLTSMTNVLYSEVAVYAGWATPQRTVRLNNVGAHLRRRQPRAGKQS